MHSIFLQKHSWPLNQKHYSVFAIDHFESNFVNPDKYKSENKPKKHIKNRISENQTLSEGNHIKFITIPRWNSNSLSGNAMVRKSACWYCGATWIISISFLLPVPQKVMPHVNVLRVRVGNRVLCDLNGTLVILIHGNERHPSLRQHKTPNLPQKQNLLPHVRHSHILRLSSRESHTLLRLGVRRNRCWVGCSVWRPVVV